MEHETYGKAPQTVREPQYDAPLDPTRTRLFRDQTGALRMTIEGDRSYLDVKLAYAFPLSDREHLIGVLDAQDHSIGLFNDLDGLDNASQELARQSLEQRYFIPDVQCIRNLREEFGVVYFDVDTNRGYRQFVVRGLRDSIDVLENGRILIADTDGNRYNVPNWQSLDARSRRLLESFI
jgi:hypothetical protein